MAEVSYGTGTEEGLPPINLPSLGEERQRPVIVVNKAPEESSPGPITVTPVEHQPDFSLQLHPVEHTPDFVDAAPPPAAPEVPFYGGPNGERTAPPVRNDAPVEHPDDRYGKVFSLINQAEEALKYYLGPHAYDAVRKPGDIAQAVLPGVGVQQGMSDAVDAGHEAQEGHYVNATVKGISSALNTMLDAVPGGHGIASAIIAGKTAIPAIFAGIGAKTANFEKLAQAQKLDAQIGNPDTLAALAQKNGTTIPDVVNGLRTHIWQTTGWYKGVDGHWKFEIGDNNAHMVGATPEGIFPNGRPLLTGGTPTDLAFSHPDAYAAYPILKTGTVDDTLTTRLPEGINPAGVSGANFGNGDISLNRNRTETPDAARSVMLHEMQHTVQAEEGFARGGAYNEPDVAKRGDALMAEQIKRADAHQEAIIKRQSEWIEAQQLLGDKRGYHDIARDYWKHYPDEKAMFDRVNEVFTDDAIGMLRRKMANLVYQRLAGEVEARNVQTRMNLTDEERRARPPWMTQSVPDKDQVVLEARPPQKPKTGNDVFKPTAWNAEQQLAPEFKQWFGDSKVIDADGTPRVVYHGTTQAFDAFSKAKAGDATGAPSAEKGFFFSSDPAVASSYAIGHNAYEASPFFSFINKMTGGLYQKFNEALLRPFGKSGIESGENIIPAYLAIKNPMEVDFKGNDYRERSFSDLIDDAKAKGHDGVLFRDAIDPGFRDKGANHPSDVYVAFEPTQIKSATGNNGNFDPAKKNIALSMDFPEVSEGGKVPHGQQPQDHAPEGPAAARNLGGRGGGEGGVAEAQGAAARAAGAYAPVEGLPVKALTLGGKPYVPGPIAKVHRVAERYMKEAGLPYEPVRTYQPVDPERAKRIADAFEKIPHAPNDPKVKASYKALIKETMAQLDVIQKSGVKIEFIKPGQRDPYHESPRLAAQDLRDNNHLWVFPTDLGFGTGSQLSGNPMLQKTGVKIDGHELVANDAFRIVHDYFGHFKDGVGFRANGEEAAWRSHSRMYSDAARPAMTTETRGQNSWVNYGPHGEANRSASSEKTVYADQKVGIMPDWTMKEGAADPFETPRNSVGNRIYNAGVDGPPNPKVQTVADPHRMMFPGIYENPKRIAAEAASRVIAEAPEMKQLWGVSRGDLEDISRGRKGNEDPKLSLAKNPKGSLAAQNIQTPKNTQRLVDILAEAGKIPGIAHADAWYTMDPVYKRMVELFGADEAPARYRHFNTMMGMASPGSDVMTEITRGTAAHALSTQGRFGEFLKHAGTPEGARKADFPKDLAHVGGHPYHRTAQGEPMAKYLEAGAIQSDAPKVPLYVHASGVPETGFQTAGPVGDAHFSRGVGLADTRKGPTDVGGSFSRAEYQTLQPWWQQDVAGKVGIESVPAQARLWTVLGPMTGVESSLGQGKLELLSIQIAKAAKRLGVTPEKARDMILSGSAGAGVMAAVAAGLGAETRSNGEN